MRKQRGITLISLVITIIVLIILAGISVNLILGQDGIISKAREAKSKQEIAEIKEKLGLDILNAHTEAVTRNEKLEQSQLEDIISNYGELQEDKDTIILKDNKGTISLQDIYKGTTSDTGSYTENKELIESLKGQIETLEQQLADASKSTSEANQEFLNFKTLVAEAITNKGVETTPEDTAEQFVANINKLSKALEPLTVKNSDSAYEGGISTSVTHTNNGYNKVYATLSTSESKYGSYSYSLKINGTKVWSGSGFGSRNTPVFDINEGDVIEATASGSKSGEGYYSVTAVLNLYVE